MIVRIPENKLITLKKSILQEAKKTKPFVERDSYTIGLEGNDGCNDYFHVQENTETEITGFHGSPSDFNDFDSSKIGAANGNAFGWGVYLSLSIDGATRYAHNGFIYNVDIPDDNGFNYIHADKKLSDSQKDKVMQKAKSSKFFPQHEYKFQDLEKILRYSGSYFYHELGSILECEYKGVSEFLSSIGIIGMMGDEETSTPFVLVFNPSLVKIIQKHKIQENIEDELAPSDVDLSSFKKDKSLAPKLWKGDKLDSRARLKLLDIADDFWDFADISWVKRKGIILTGSICNYNWSKYSDIDLHIIVDFSEISDRKDFVQEYFDSKKNEWNDEHDDLKIYGFPVEIYVEDVGAKTESGGIYDLNKNKWIKKANPDDIQSISLDKYEIKDKTAALATKIENYESKVETIDDDAQLRKLEKKNHKLWTRIKGMRKYGLKRSGETDPYNIVYKCLRRMGYLDRIWAIDSKIYNKLNSVE